jgi:hypothetical protein
MFKMHADMHVGPYVLLPDSNQNLSVLMNFSKTPQ